MNSQATTRPDLSAAWTVFRHIAFWGGWAFRMLIVVPSVAFCLLLAVYSDFSFSTIPQEVLQRIADTAKYPAAPDGYVTMRTCKDSKPAVKDLAPPVACKTFGFEQQSIAESALAAGQNLATMYCIFVLLGFGWVLMVGSFTSSRHAFRASLQKGRQAKGTVAAGNESCTHRPVRHLPTRSRIASPIGPFIRSPDANVDPRRTESVAA